ncbi:phage tail protein [Kumtagia ephedrae]|uniref:Phage tail protein n=1 Tax=Kumtagia ephedrae TaxID=2116701 RepID=A0A2P7STC9_9HYPH|nr:tail fiber protein [Mesorhizobium ephedrae]PSJ65701.1 phage tail protein [Mesorhizobium ephedrae]
MAEPFLSEIKIVSFNFPPKGWAFCNGQLLPINQNQALFSLLGTTYGGDGRVTFALPNLRGRSPIHMGDGHTLGEAAGSTSVTVTPQQMPAHTHAFMGRNELPAATTANATPGGTKVLAQGNASLQSGQTAAVSLYGPPASLNAMAPQAVSNAGGSQAHTNMMPYLVLNFVIALQGIFPSRN